MQHLSLQDARQNFATELAKQRWDDHRLYHHSRVNQSLHLVSAMTFLGSYVMVWFNALWAVLIGWFVAMWLRQVGHFFFEPKHYDTVNALSHQAKEDIKVGYNLRRKIVLLSLWALIPLVLWWQPTFFGAFSARPGWAPYFENLTVLWLWLAVGAVLFRTGQLYRQQDLQTGLVWMTKILTDPVHDIKMYHRAPLHLLRGERLDPMTHVSH